MTTPGSRKRCCPDQASVCSLSRQLFFDAVRRAGKAKADFGTKPRRCWREVFQDEARPDPRPTASSDVVFLRSRRSRQAAKDKSGCGCEVRMLDEMKPEEHQDVCMRTLTWVVRVPYETQAGRKALADSIRMCRVDAARLAHEYRQHKAKIVRVFPLYG